MLPATYEFITTSLAVLFSAIAIKLADDFLDQDIDQSQYNFASILGKGSMLYAMLSLAFAASLNAPISVSFFLSSYIIGMFRDLRQDFPSHLTGFQESLIVFLAGVFLLGCKMMFFTFFFVLSIQLLDDYIDDAKDKLSGYRNWAHRLGRTKCLLVFFLTLLSSWNLDETMFLSSCLGTCIFYSFTLYYQRERSSW